jgi:hypothetical protein
MPQLVNERNDATTRDEVYFNDEHACLFPDADSIDRPFDAEGDSEPEIPSTANDDPFQLLLDDFVEDVCRTWWRS